MQTHFLACAMDLISFHYFFNHKEVKHRNCCYEDYLVIIYRSVLQRWSIAQDKDHGHVSANQLSSPSSSLPPTRESPQPCLLRGHTLPSHPSSRRCHVSLKTNLAPSPQIQAFLQSLSPMDSIKGPPGCKSCCWGGDGTTAAGREMGKGEGESPLLALLGRWTANWCLQADSEFAESQPN